MILKNSSQINYDQLNRTIIKSEDMQNLISIKILKVNN